MADEKLNTGPAENISPEAAEPIATPEQAAASEPQQEQTGDIKGVGSDYSKSNDWYIKRAVNGTSKFRGVVAQIVGKGNPTSIDTVSGATCSSDTIIELVKKALEDAKNN